MRIVEQGQLPEDKLYTATCTNCRTKFEFTCKEATETMDRNVILLKVNCPLCKRVAMVAK